MKRAAATQYYRGEMARGSSFLLTFDAFAWRPGGMTGFTLGVSAPVGEASGVSGNRQACR